MSKYYGRVGYVKQVESQIPGVVKEKVVIKRYRGDIFDINKRWQSSENGTNDNLTISNQISIVPRDTYAWKNWTLIRFVEYMGVFWEVSSIKLERPRIILTIGEIYNGSTEEN